MAIGSKSSFVIRDEEFEAGYIETLDQTVADFNVGFGGAINLVTQDMEGDYNKTRFFDLPTGGYVRRNITDVSTALTPSTMTQDTHTGVKLSRRFGPYAMTEDAWRRVGRSPEEMSVFLGEAYALAKSKEVLNTTIAALNAALGTYATNTYDYAADGSNKIIDHTALIRAKNKMGDAAGKIICWVGRSEPYSQLVEGQLSVASGNVGDFAVYQGQAGSLGLPFYVSDIPSLTVTGTPGEYNILGLVAGAASVFMNGMPIVALDRVLLKENIERVLQGEDDYSLKLKGFSWDTANGGVNPDATAAALGTNWDAVVASNKDVAGVRLDVDKS